MLRRLRSTRFVAVVGTSGSGKSSLVRSGLIPSLQSGYLVGASSTWRMAVCRPGDEPIAHLAEALVEPGVLDAAADLGAERRVMMEATLRRGPLGLVDAVRHSRLPAGDNLLVLVDQFEELFRFRRSSHVANSRDESIAFVRLLLDASAHRDVPIYLVLTMRSDFIGDCMVFPGLSDAVNAGLYLVGRMSRDALRSAITGPVAVGGGAIAARLVNRVLNDLGDDQDQLPTLQHALMRTWDRWASAGTDRPIDVEDYEAVGTFNGALARHAEEAYSEVATAGLGHLAEHVFRGLTDTFTDSRGTRRPTSIADLAAISGVAEADVIRLVEMFRRAGRSFLMPPPAVALTSRTVVDLSHESLMRCWSRLIDWAEKERAAAEFYMRLSQAAGWFADGTAGLWRNPELELAARWVSDTHPNAAWAGRYDESFERAMSFLDRSVREHDRCETEAERRRQAALRRTQAVALTLATLLVAVALAAYVAWRERTRAESNLDLARAAVDESLSAIDRDPSLLGADVPQVKELRRELLAKAEQFYVGFMKQAPQSERLRRDVAFAHLRLGHIDRMLEKRDAATREYGDAIARFSSLAAARPASLEYRAALGDAYNWLGETLRPIPGRSAGAERAYDSAFALQQTLVRDAPGDGSFRRALARTHYNRGILRSSRPDRAADAEADFREAVRLLEPLAAGDRHAAHELARADNNLGGLLAADDRRASEVQSLWEKAIALDERLSRAEPENREYRSELATYCANLAAFLSDRGATESADRRIRQAIGLIDELARVAPSLAVARADAHDIRAQILEAQEATVAEREFSAALDLFVDAARDPALERLPDFHLRFGDLLLNLAGFSRAARDADRARALLARASEAYAALAATIADGGSSADARLARDTIARVAPSLPDHDRTVLMAADQRLQRRGDAR